MLQTEIPLRGQSTIEISDSRAHDCIIERAALVLREIASGKGFRPTYFNAVMVALESVQIGDYATARKMLSFARAENGSGKGF